MLERIKALCTEKGITIYRLERELGFGNGTARKWANSIPGSDKLKRIANYFGVTVDELLRDTQPGNAPPPVVYDSTPRATRPQVTRPVLRDTQQGNAPGPVVVDSTNSRK